MKVKTMDKPAFQLAGLVKETKMGELLSTLWDELFDLLGGPPEKPSMGACYDMKEDGTFRYMAGYEYTPGEPVPEGLVLVDMPAASYAVISLRGAVPVCIHEGWGFVMEEYLPQQGLEHAGTPDFEVYYPGNVTSEEYEMELWVPVKKKEENHE